MATDQGITLTNPDTLVSLFTAARTAGLPREQAGRFVKHGYVPLQQMLPFHAACRECDEPGGPDEVLLAGTRGPGKSHAALAQVVLDDCLRVPGLKFLFLRKVQKSAGESLEDLVSRVCRAVSHKWNPSSGKLTLFNGSRVVIGGYKDPSDIEKYVGIEYDGIVVEEATQLTEDKIDRIRGSLRSTKPGWRERMYMTTNADGPGVKWCKQRFVFPWRQGQQGSRRYVEAYYQGNPYLKDTYIRFLEGLRGSLARAWARLDWDAFEGMAFETWNYDQHVVTPFEIPDSWLRWRAVDWGSYNPFACLWFAKQPDIGRIYVYREAYQTGLTDSQQATRILDMTPANERIAHTYADPASYWEKKSGEGQTFYTAEEIYRKHNVILTRADNARIAGKRRVDTALSLLPDGRPGLQVFSTCTNLIDQLSNLVRDETHPEDVDSDMEDHAYDALRYGLSNYLAASERKPAAGQQAAKAAWQGARKIL